MREGDYKIYEFEEWKVGQNHCKTESIEILD